MLATKLENYFNNCDAAATAAAMMMVVVASDFVLYLLHHLFIYLVHEHYKIYMAMSVYDSLGLETTIDVNMLQRALCIIVVYIVRSNSNAISIFFSGSKSLKRKKMQKIC